jgi:lysylphosphatidylglycerol synthetase-like protein (DUF2156 family)
MLLTHDAAITLLQGTPAPVHQGGQTAREFTLTTLLGDFTPLDWVFATIAATVLVIASLVALRQGLRRQLAKAAAWSAIALAAPALAFIVFSKTGSHGMFVTLEVSKGACAGVYALVACLLGARATADRSGLALFLGCAIVTTIAFLYLSTIEAPLTTPVRPTEIITWVMLLCLGTLALRAGRVALAKPPETSGPTETRTCPLGSPDRRSALSLCSIAGLLFVIMLGTYYSSLANEESVQIHQAISESRRRVKVLLRQADGREKELKNAERELQETNISPARRSMLQQTIKDAGTALTKLRDASQQAEKLVYLAEQLRKSNTLWSPRDTEMITSILKDEIAEDLEDIEKMPKGRSGIEQLNRLLQSPQ